MKMTENFEIIGNFVKDMSSETPDVQTFLFVKEKISGYQLNIDINSKALKNGIIEVNIILKFTDKPEILKKSYFDHRVGRFMFTLSLIWQRLATITLVCG